MAKLLEVSRQVIVGDVAILRAGGLPITATSKGYIIEKYASKHLYTGALVCRHNAAQMKQELYTVVDYGGEVLDVTVEHNIYGQLSGNLRLASRYDVDRFLYDVNRSDSKPLSDLTGGIHMHQIGCNSAKTFDIIREKLRLLGICY